MYSNGSETDNSQSLASSSCRTERDGSLQKPSQPVHAKIRISFLPVAVIDLPQAASIFGRLLKTILLFPFLAAAFTQGVIVDHWTNENGLTVNSVLGICQEPKGYLWLATYEGLVRFDGVRFVPFNKSSSDGILSDRFFGGWSADAMAAFGRPPK